MVRAPCCEKMGLKRGPWTREEDLILINYISLYGHGNWRALPKQAGLLRCGKSCRLRWMNYLRPDIKRGNFSREEEETIIKLHEMLGNRWSAIAARLPGRTDNEIKNVWNTHLKKRIKQKQAVHVTEKEEPEPVNYPSQVRLGSPQHSASDLSSVTTTTSDTAAAAFMDGDDALGNFPEVDEDFWSDVFSADNSAAMSDFPEAGSDRRVQCQVGHGYGSNSSFLDDNMEFWFNLLTGAGELPDLAEF